LEQARDGQARQAEERQAQIGQLTQARDEQLGKLNQELRDARQTASLSVKLQMLREADLKDLQARYQASLFTQEEQHQLLEKLGERLSVVSNYFHQMVNSEATTLPNNEKKLKPSKRISPSQAKRSPAGKTKKDS
ncbi:hypothetical protein, partial [Methyloglobulus sp.]|uniref:hypothetical protein n=1 Tax=Methyloglobulus sp. TaxID=2518622 RepID=UPI0032B87C52